MPPRIMRVNDFWVDSSLGSFCIIDNNTWVGEAPQAVAGDRVAVRWSVWLDAASREVYFYIRRVPDGVDILVDRVPDVPAYVPMWARYDFTMPSERITSLVVYVVDHEGGAEAWSAIGLVALPEPSTITLTLSPPTVGPSGLVRASGVLKRAGVAYPGATVKVTLTGISGSVVTGSDGSYSFDFNAPGTPGDYTVTATFDGDTQTKGSTDSKPLTVTGETPYTSSITIELSPSACRPGDQVVVSGKLTYDGAALTDRIVNVKLAGELVGTLTTDANGNYSLTLTAPAAEGTYTLEASYAGEATISASSATATLRVTTGPIPTSLGAALTILGASAVATTLAIAATR